MKSFVRFTLRQTVFLNVIFIILTVAGVFSLFTTPVENMPPVDIGKVFITTIYYGASADDVENLVTNEIEDALDGLENVEYIQSKSRRNSSTVEVKFLDDTDYRDQYDELRFRVLNIRNKLPEGVDDPMFFYVDTKLWIPVIVVNLVGESGNRTLKLVADELKNNLIKIDGVQSVDISGEYDKEFHVTIDPQKLRDLGISFAEVSDAIRSFNTRIPTGRFRKGSRNMMLDTGNVVDSQEEVLNVVVRRDGDGNFIYVRDLATASGISHRDPDTIMSVNGISTIKLMIKKENSGNSVTITEKVKAISAAFEAAHKRDGLSIITTYDSTVEIDDSVRTLGGNLMLGMAMVVVVLWITLGFRNAMLTAIGIPFSFLVTLIIVKYSGQSINTISLFSFVLVSGIIVDDAIIVVENVYRHFEMGKGLRDSVIDGASEVILPISSSALTTILAFIPMLIMTGTTGDFFSVIPKAVSFALCASLLEAVFCLPVHIIDWGPRRRVRKDYQSGAYEIDGNSLPATAGSEAAGRKGLSRKLFGWLWDFYSAILSYLLNHRITGALLVSSAFVSALAIMLLSVTGKVPLIKVKFFQDSYLRYHIAFKMPPGTSVEGTDRVVRDLSDYILSFGDKEVSSVNGTAGMMESKDYERHRSQHYGQVVVELPSQKRMALPGVKGNDVNAYLDIVREKLIAFSDEHYRAWGGRPVLDIFGENTGPPVGKAVNIRISASTIDEAKVASDSMMEYLRKGSEFSDLVNLDDNRADNQLVVRQIVNQKKALEYGLDSRTATALIAGTLNGMSGGKFRTDDEEIPLLIRLARMEDIADSGSDDTFQSGGVRSENAPDHDTVHREIVRKTGRSAIASPEDILEVPVIEHSASPVYIGDIASVTYEEEPDIRSRYNGKPTITIIADIKDGSKLSAGRVALLSSQYFRKIAYRYPGVTLNFGGEFESTSRAYRSLMFAFLIAVMGIYLVLSSQFNDYLQPLIILSSIAFAFIGVVFGMLFTRSVFTIGSFLAVVGLAGVAVNDAIVLIDFMNQSKDSTRSLREAVLYSCRARMRPVLITTITTILGMLPMVMGIPQKSVTWAPMATAFVTGLFSATILTLLFIPVEYEMTEIFKNWVKRFLGR